MCRRAGGDATSGHVTACFWDTQTSGQADECRRAQARPRPRCRSEPATVRVGLGGGGRAHDIWTEPEGGGYPILCVADMPRDGIACPASRRRRGTANDPYLISTAEELNSIGHNPRLMKCHFRLADMISTVAGLHFYPIGDRDLSIQSGL